MDFPVGTQDENLLTDWISLTSGNLNAKIRDDFWTFSIWKKELVAPLTMRGLIDAVKVKAGQRAPESHANSF